MRFLGFNVIVLSGGKTYSQFFHIFILDSIEANVDTAAVHVETANVQLEKAKSYQKAARKKMCCILVILLIAAGALALIIWVAVKNS